jgi:hypothetical protein
MKEIVGRGKKTVSAMTLAILLLLLLVPSWPIAYGNANFDVGPYTLNMHFSELPKPWWEGTWWDANWTSRQKLTFDTRSLTEDLADFPVMIWLDSSRIDYASTLANGNDIRFIDADGSTELSYEIEKWDETATSIVWVKVPLIDADSTSDYIWMYYNNSVAPDAQNAQDVWSNGYVGVMHLGENPSGIAPQMRDSTVNANHGTTGGSMVSSDSVNGKIGKGLQLDGINDIINVTDNPSLDSTNDEGTLELWLRWTNASDGDNQIIMSSSNRYAVGANDGYEWTSQGDGDHYFYPWSGDANNFNLGPNPFTDGVWHHVAVSLNYSLRNVSIYVDNTPMLLSQANVPFFWSTLASPNDWLWGGNPDRSTRYFDGVFDEIRVSNVIRSSDWSAAQYRSMTDIFVTFGSMENQYPYRQRITITSDSYDVPAGYAVSTTFDHAVLVSAGKSQADGDDIRVVYWDSSRWVELDRILDPISSWNNTSTTIWFALQQGMSASSSDGNYYLYYGSPLAENPPTKADVGTRIKSVQSGTATNMVNGVTTVNISPVNMSKSFLIFNTRHSSNRPVGSEISGRIATPSSLEFVRVTDQIPPNPIDIQWYVVEYDSGVRVQRGQVFETSSTIDVSINPIALIDQAFVTWSKTPGLGDQFWNYDDPIVGELTSQTNLQFRISSSSVAHIIWWQVVEFTKPGSVDVQRGSITTMTGTSTSANATLSRPVDVNKTFVLTGFQTPDAGADVGARMLRAQLINSTTIMVDRGISGDPDDIPEISWQAVELRDCGRVLAGSEHLGVGVNRSVIPLATAVDTNRSVAFASVQPVSGQSMGRTTYAGDDVIGVASVTMALSPTQVIMERSNTSGDADIGWFVVEFEKEKAMTTLGLEETVAEVHITVSVYHTRPDGTDPQEIVTSPIVTINSSTPNPLSVDVGSGSQLNFTDTDPRLLRLGINMTNASDGEGFVLAYDSIAQPSSLDTPISPPNPFYLHDMDRSGTSPAGKQMNSTMGAGGASMAFTTGQEEYWYAPLWSPPSVNILSPTQSQHLTNAYNVVYSASSTATSISFEYHDGLSWTYIGQDADMDGSFPWDTCTANDGIVTLKATVANTFNDIGEDTVSGIEIDCTPPSIQILQPPSFSIVEDTVPIVYVADIDAVMVELRYDDGSLHTIETDVPPDGTATWDVQGLTLSGAILRAQVWDEVGLTSQTEVFGLSTPEDPLPQNQPPTISGVPDLVVHYDYSYNFDLTPYINDEDNSSQELTVWTSDSIHIWESPENNLGIVMNYPQSMLDQTVQVTIWVTDGIGTDYQVINVTVDENYPPEKLRPLPDVIFDEDEVVLNAFFTNLDYYFLDVDGDNLYYTSGNSSVRIRINANNTVDMWAEEDWFGFEIITIRATDPTAALVEEVVIVQVNPVNDAPVIEEIPEIHVRGGRTSTFELFDFIYDIDSPLDSLNVSTTSRYIQTSGFNLTLQYPQNIREELVTIIVSDGIDSSERIVRVVVHLDEDYCILLWILMVATLMNVLAWGMYLANRRQIYAGFLLREDGSLIKEMPLTGRQTVPYGLIRERIRSQGMMETQRLDFEKYRVDVVHGKKLHLAVVSSLHLSKLMVKKLRDAVEMLGTKDLDETLLEDDQTKIQHVLEEFETKFRRIGKNT